MSKRTGIIVAAVITGIGTVVAGIVGAKTDNFHVVVGPLPVQTVTATTTVAAPPLPAPTVTVTVPDEPIEPGPSADTIADPFDSAILLADLESEGSFGTEMMKIDGVAYPNTVGTSMWPCAGGGRSQATWTWEGDVTRLVGQIGITDESFNDAIASLAVYEGNGVSKLLKRLPASIDGLTKVNVPLDGVYTITLVAESDGRGKPDCSDVKLAFIDAKLERPTSG